MELRGRQAVASNGVLFSELEAGAYAPLLLVDSVWGRLGGMCPASGGDTFPLVANKALRG